MVVMAEGHADTLCDCCRYNDVIPGLDIIVNASEGPALEGAKRRLFHTLDVLKLPTWHRKEKALAFSSKLNRRTVRLNGR